MKTPWARGNIPSPNERRKLPSQSNTIIGCSPRLKTNTLSCLSTPTPPISLNDQPGGSFAQFSTGSYVYSPLPTVVTASILYLFHSQSLSRSGRFGQLQTGKPLAAKSVKLPSCRSSGWNEVSGIIKRRGGFHPFIQPLQVRPDI